MKENKSLTVQYCQAAEVIKTAILQGQYEVLKGENRIQLAVYYGIGKYVSLNSRKGKWGTGALAVISGHLRKILPGLRGFSADSLKKMRLFYEAWTILEYNSSVADENNSVITITELDSENKSGQEIAEATGIDIYHTMIIPNTPDFPAAEFLSVPFTHHSRILSKTKNLQERY